MRFQARRQVFLINKEIWNQSANHNDFIKQISQLGCHVETCPVDKAQLLDAIPVAG